LAPVVTDECREYERENLKYIASTFQGTGAAIGLKAMRSSKDKIGETLSRIAEVVPLSYC